MKQHLSNRTPINIMRSNNTNVKAVVGQFKQMLDLIDEATEMLVSGIEQNKIQEKLREMFPRAPIMNVVAAIEIADETKNTP